MKIERLIFKNDESKALGKLTVLIGPNNVGKSRLLRDILELVSPTTGKSVLLSKIEVGMISRLEDIAPDAHWEDNIQGQNLRTFLGLRSNLLEGLESNANIDQLANLLKNPSEFVAFPVELRRFSAAYVDAESRLRIAKTAESHNPSTEPARNLLQLYFMQRKKVESELQKIFKETFNKYLFFDYSAMKSLCFRVSDEAFSCPQIQQRHGRKLPSTVNSMTKATDSKVL